MLVDFCQCDPVRHEICRLSSACRRSCWKMPRALMPIAPCLESLRAMTTLDVLLGPVRPQGYNRIIQVDWEYKNDTDTWIRLSDVPWPSWKLGSPARASAASALVEVPGWFLSGHSGLAASPLNVWYVNISTEAPSTTSQAMPRFVINFAPFSFEANSSHSFRATAYFEGSADMLSCRCRVRAVLVQRNGSNICRCILVFARKHTS